MVLGAKLLTVYLFFKYFTNLPNELKRRLKIAVTALVIMRLAVCLKMYVKVKVSLSLKACKESLMDPREEKNLLPLPDFETPDLPIVPTTHLRFP